MSIAFAKGHGTENDFVIVPDPDGVVPLSAEQVRALCHRRTGIGGDGVLRVVRAAKDPDAVAQAAEAEWFMDYRNADGSVAEMCGNGVRVFARYLMRFGFAEPGEFDIATRDGVKRLRSTPDGSITVDMGRPQLLGRSRARIGDETFTGIAVEAAGTPHLVCVAEGEVDEVDLTAPPSIDNTVFPHGANVEFVNVLAGDGSSSWEERPSLSLSVRMRVHERGAGETRSCGTGAVAAAAAALSSETTAHVAAGVGGTRPGTVMVQVPGGRLTVSIDEATSYLTGPAVISATGEWTP